MDVTLTGEVWHWRGPAPHHFVTVPADLVPDVAALAPSYGWGMVPVEVALGASRWRTSLWPRDGGYVVPLRAAVRRAEGVDLGDVVTVTLRA